MFVHKQKGDVYKRQIQILVKISINMIPHMDHNFDALMFLAPTTNFGGSKYKNSRIQQGKSIIRTPSFTKICRVQKLS